MFPGIPTAAGRLVSLECDVARFRLAGIPLVSCLVGDVLLKLGGLAIEGVDD